MSDFSREIAEHEALEARLQNALQLRLRPDERAQVRAQLSAVAEDLQFMRQSQRMTQGRESQHG